MNIESNEAELLLAVAVALIDPAGMLLAANAGFLHLLCASRTGWIGADVSRFFIRPGFRSIAAAGAADDSEVYQGLLTIGEWAGKARTLTGRIRRRPEGFRLVAEYDIVELEKITEMMEELNSDSVRAQRRLEAENTNLKSSRARILQSALTDELTGIGNRRRLDEAFETEIARAARTRQPLSAIMADLDRFKRVNDDFGHAVGDKVLAHFGGLLRSQSRPTDIVARFGGEEFVVLMPHTDLAQGAALAERVRMLLASRRIEPLPEPVTCSFGVSEYSPGEEVTSFMQRIDAALYEAKRSGRNRVVSVQPPASPLPWQP